MNVGGEAKSVRLDHAALGLARVASVVPAIGGAQATRDDNGKGLTMNLPPLSSSLIQVMGE
jgi:hypothetical protein